MQFFNLKKISTVFIRCLAALEICLMILFLLNNYLVYWLGWPSFRDSFAYTMSFHSTENNFSSLQTYQCWWQIVIYFLCILGTILLVNRSSSRLLSNDAELYTRLARFVIRASFWSVFLIGIVDVGISCLRVENLLSSVVGKEVATQLGRPIYRGSHIHYYLILLSIIITFFSRTLGFTWLTFLIVLAEFQIVLTRFIFSYEQAFMGDLVRFWYAALFLFASSYTLLYEGHVRVDILYTNFSERKKAISNIVGSLLFGLPLCWMILVQGMSGKGSSINSPLLSYEISQSGFGMYVKYLMAGFLLIFSVSMTIQFVSSCLSNFSMLFNEKTSNKK